jgi:hypothetical protein
MLTKEIITNYFGFKNAKNTYMNFIKQNLIPNFIENDDYKLIDKSKEIVQKYIKILLVIFNELKIWRSQISEIQLKTR